MSHSEGYPDMGHTTGFYQGVTSERERIINLIEEELKAIKALPLAENDGRVVIAKMAVVEGLINKITNTLL